MKCRIGRGSPVTKAIQFREWIGDNTIVEVDKEDIFKKCYVDNGNGIAGVFFVNEQDLISVEEPSKGKEQGQ